jgi:hypothetical protein
MKNINPKIIIIIIKLCFYFITSNAQGPVKFSCESDCGFIKIQSAKNHNRQLLSLQSETGFVKIESILKGANCVTFGISDVQQVKVDRFQMKYYARNEIQKEIVEAEIVRKEDIKVLDTFSLQKQVPTNLDDNKGKFVQEKSSTKNIQTVADQAIKFPELLPDLKILNYKFVDENNNNILDADEQNYFVFDITNEGNGKAEGVYLQSGLEAKSEGIEITPKTIIDNILPGDSIKITIPVVTNLDLQNGFAQFNFELIERRGFDAFPLNLIIETQEFKEPNIKVVDATFSNEEGGKIKLNYPMNLKILVQNIGEGNARNTDVGFYFDQPNCIVLDDTNVFYLGELTSGEFQELNFLFTAGRRYTYNEIPIRISMSEKYKKFGNDTVISLDLNQDLLAYKPIKIEGIKEPVKEIGIASLVSDVDKNIPVDTIKHYNKFALIIGNEDYTSKQRSIKNESNVVFARRDAQIFKEYTIKTLGLPSDNVFLLEDATTGEMLQYIEIISKIASKVDSSELLFYYAGHGMPDEVSKEPYLIPVDITGANLNAAIRLSDVYTEFAESGANKISIFLDACFSGGGRQGELLASRSIRVKPKDEELNGNTIVFSASNEDQIALPYYEQKHGMFTYFLLKKLKESGGNVTYGELFDYISNNVSIQSLKINKKDQDPIVRVSLSINDNWKYISIK